MASSALFSNQSRWPVLRRKDDSGKGYSVYTLKNWLDVVRTKSINANNDFAKDL